MMMMQQKPGSRSSKPCADLPEEGEQMHCAKPVQVVQQEGLCHILFSPSPPPLPAPLGKQALQQGLYALHILLNVLL